jgi:hypothetical protein
MAKLTYFVVQPFIMKRGHMAPAGQPLTPQSERAARRLAERLALTNPAVLAFSRAGDPGTGEFDDAVVLAKYGDIPDEALEAMAP